MAQTIGLNDTLIRYLNQILDHRTRLFMETVLLPQADLDSSQCLTSAGLAIHGAASALVKTGGSDCYLIAEGTIQKITAATDLAALSGTVTNAKYNVYCFDIDRSGTVTSSMGAEAATLAGVVFPKRLKGQARIGFIIVHPTGAGNFVGGTTALDDAGVVPNVVYVSPTGSYDPSIVTGI